MATKPDYVPGRATVAVTKLLLDETRALVKNKEWDAYLAQSVLQVPCCLVSDPHRDLESPL